MDWMETTLRKGTKTPKVCRDMFITDSRGVFRFAMVKNGRMKHVEILSESEAKEIIIEHRLVPTPALFNKCYTYRTQKSTDLVYKILNT